MAPFILFVCIVVAMAIGLKYAVRLHVVGRSRIDKEAFLFALVGATLTSVLVEFIVAAVVALIIKAIGEGYGWWALAVVTPLVAFAVAVYYVVSNPEKMSKGI